MSESIVSQKFKFVAGVDTHAKTHHLTLIDKMGKVIGQREMKTTLYHMEKSIDWVIKKTDGDVLFAIEGTSSYGETLTVALTNVGISVCEVKAPKAKSRGQAGKTDAIDSLLAAKSILSVPLSQLIKPKSQGVIKILRLLLATRKRMNIQQVMEENALFALLRTNNLGVGIVTNLKSAMKQIMGEQPRKSIEDYRVETFVAEMEAVTLILSIADREAKISQNKKSILSVVQNYAPSLLTLTGFGPVTAAQVLCSYSHKGRFHSADAFACLAGTTPLPASSGQVVRHRLSRYGDRELNQALSTIVMCRLRCDKKTKQYAEKCSGKGKSLREIRRSLKHYVARSIFKHLENLELSDNSFFLPQEVYEAPVNSRFIPDII